MKTGLGVLMIIGAIIMGLYVGIWVCFVGGIAGLVDVVNGAIKGNEISGMAVAKNLAKILFAGFAGWGSFTILFIPGKAMLD